jgi:hypothetical protein
LGLAPAALYGTKFVKGQSMVPNADIPRGRFDKSYLPERQLFGQPDQYGMRPGGSYGPALPSSLRPVDENRLFAVQKYNQVAASPVTYQPNSINDYIYRTANELRQGGMHGQAHTPENSPEYYALLTRWYNDHAGRATPVTALELDQLRQDLRGLPSGTYSGIAGGKAADRLDIYMHTPPPGQVASGTQSELDDLRSNIEDARGAWRSYKTADTIEQSLVDAKNSAAVHRRDEGQAVQNVLDQYANSPAGRQAIFGATQNELATIGQAAKGDLGNRALNKMGDILTTGKASGAGGLAGGALGGALGLDWTTAAALATAGASLPPAAGTVMRWGAQPGMARKAQEALDTIRMNSPLYQQRVTGSPAPPPQGFTPYGGPATAGPPIGGNPPVENANVMARDAVTYALMPQIQKKGEDVWSGTDMPFEAMPNPEAGRNIEPTMFGGWTLPDRKIIHPPIPRVYIDQPAESYDPALENR